MTFNSILNNTFLTENLTCTLTEMSSIYSDDERKRVDDTKAVYYLYVHGTLKLINYSMSTHSVTSTNFLPPPHVDSEKNIKRFQ